MTGTERTKEPIAIRRATLDDIDRLAELCSQLGYPLSAPYLLPRLVEIGHNEANDVYVAVEPAGRVIGWLQVYVRQLLMVERHAEMGGLVVDRDYRGRGIGRLLVDWAESWARDHGCRSLYLRSNVQREEAHRFYERLGYQLVKVQHAYWKSVVGQEGATGNWVSEPEAGATRGTGEQL